MIFVISYFIDHYIKVHTHIHAYIHTHTYTHNADISVKGNQKLLDEEGQTMLRPKEKGQTTIYTSLHRILKIEQHEPH